MGIIGTKESAAGDFLKVSGVAMGPVLGLSLVAVFVLRVPLPAALPGFGYGVLHSSAAALPKDVCWPRHA